jgi:hypothetical protein
MVSFFKIISKFQFCLCQSSNSNMRPDDGQYNQNTPQTHYTLLQLTWWKVHRCSCNNADCRILTCLVMWYQNRMLKCGWQSKHRGPQGRKKNLASINTTQTAARIAGSVMWLDYRLDETRIMTAFLEGVETPKCPGLP